MGTNYEHLTAEERATLMVMRADGCSQRAVARRLGRSPSTISRELARNASCCKPAQLKRARTPGPQVSACRRTKDRVQGGPCDRSQQTSSGPAPGSTTKPKARSRYRAVRRHV